MASKYDTGSKYDSNTSGSGTSLVTKIGNAVSNLLPGLRIAVGKFTGEDTTEYQKKLAESKKKLLNPEPVVIKNAQGKYQQNKAGMEAATALVMSTTGGDDLAKVSKGFLQSLAKETDQKILRNVLDGIGYKADNLEALIPSLSKARTVEEVKDLLMLSESKTVSKLPTDALESPLQKGIATTKLPPELPIGQTSSKVPLKTPSLERSLPQHMGGSLPEDISTSVDKLTAALKEVKPLRGEQEALYKTERAKRIQAAQNIRATAGTGEAGFRAELSQFKGEMPKVQFESLRSKVEQGDIDNLFRAVVQSNKLTEFEKISARNGLSKMFGETGGTIPTEGEIRLLSQVLPEDTITALMKNRSVWTKAKEAGVSILNLPRAILATGDMSAPFRQGLFLIGKPKQFAGAFGGMFKQFASETAFKAVQEEITTRPTYLLMREAKLALTDVGPNMSMREERFLSNMTEKIPVFGKLSKASNRAYVGFLNKLRADVFDNFLLKASESGIDIHNNPKVVKDLATFINNATGRGNLGALERSAGALNGIFFSPRLIASRVNMLNPVSYMKMEPFARKQALKTMLSSSSILLSILGLAKLGGADVGADPTSADFGKIKIGNTRIDIGGGMQQYLKLGAQLITGKVTSTTSGKVTKLGEGYKPMTRFDVLERFFMGKENPAVSLFTDWLVGSNLIGEKFELGPEVVERFIPLLWQDMNDTLKEWGPVGTAFGVPAIFGAGVQTYTAPKKKRSGGGY